MVVQILSVEPVLILLLHSFFPDILEIAIVHIKHH